MLKAFNRVIKILIFSDFILNSGWGLIAPIFAIFLVQRISFGDQIEAAKVAGFASLIYWVSKSILQIPIANYLDKKRGEKDDFWCMFFGGLLSAIAPFGFVVSTSPFHIYFFQFLRAIGMAMNVPAWLAIFTRHIDKGKEALEWGIKSTSLGIGIGIAGAVGGVLVATLGFEIAFSLVGIFNLISTFLLLAIFKEIFPREKIFPKIPFFDHFKI